MPESKRHRMICEAVAQMLRRITRGAHVVGCDQFVYYDATNPKRCVAPDAFVRLGLPDFVFPTFKTWEHGAPDLAIEITSPADSPERHSWREKLVHYRRSGVRELVACNVDAKRGKRLRVWDRLDGDLVERIVERDASPCLTLDLWLHVGAVDSQPVGLRLARDPQRRDTIPTDLEALAASEARAKALEAELTAARGSRARKKSRKR